MSPDGKACFLYRYYLPQKMFPVAEWKILGRTSALPIQLFIVSHRKLVISISWFPQRCNHPICCVSLLSMEFLQSTNQKSVVGVQSGILFPNSGFSIVILDSLCSQDTLSPGVHPLLSAIPLMCPPLPFNLSKYWTNYIWEFSFPFAFTSNNYCI